MDQPVIKDTVILHGKRKPYNQRSLLLFEDTIEDRLRLDDHREILRPWSLAKVRKVYHWLLDNQVAEDDCMLCYHAHWQAHTDSIAVRYHLQLERDEHRTLFLLCKDGILDTEEETA